MKSKMGQNMIFSALAHLLIIMSLLGLSLFSCRERRKPREMVTFIELQTVAPKAPDVPAPQPKQASVPPLPKPEPKPLPKPEPRQIKVSDKVVVRDQTPAKPQIRPEDIRDALAVTDKPKSSHVERGEFERYLAIVRGILYNAWKQPGTATVPVGTEARAMIRVQRDGRITSRKITVSSGNDIMDSSVMKALESVQSIPPLPRDRGDYEDVTVGFELTGL